MTQDGAGHNKCPATIDVPWEMGGGQDRTAEHASEGESAFINSVSFSLAKNAAPSCVLALTHRRDLSAKEAY